LNKRREIVMGFRRKIYDGRWVSGRNRMGWNGIGIGMKSNLIFK
jgi:hypothetical protein